MRFTAALTKTLVSTTTLIRLNVWSGLLRRTWRDFRHIGTDDKTESGILRKRLGDDPEAISCHKESCNLEGSVLVVHYGDVF